MTSTPTGRVERHGDGHVLLLTRTFRASVWDVWAAVTEPDRLLRWIGTFTGDPAEGRVMFQMTAEEGALPEEMEIRECTPPHTLKVTAHVGDQRWLMDVDLTEAGGVTTLTFSQPGIDPTAVESVGPGWEYYLDRLVTAETGGDPSTIDFDRDYYPAMREYYQKQLD